MFTLSVYLLLGLLAHSDGGFLEDLLGDPAPPPPPPPSKGIMGLGSDLKSGVTSSISSKLSRMNSHVNQMLFDKIDGVLLSDHYKAAFDEIRSKMGKTSCIQGLSAKSADDENLRLTDGKLTDLNKMSTSVTVLTEGNDNDNINADVVFTLPPQPNIRFSFLYDAYRYVMRVERDGSVDVKQEGPVSLKFSVKLPRSKQAVDNMLANGDCPGHITSVQTVVDKKLAVEGVHYSSIANTVGLGMTGKAVSRMVEGLSDDIQDNIAAALRYVVEPIFRKSPFNCQDPSYALPVDRKPVDCKAVRPAAKFKA